MATLRAQALRSSKTSLEEEVPYLGRSKVLCSQGKRMAGFRPRLFETRRLQAFTRAALNNDKA